MLIIGLTGSIGMGKTTVANHMASRGIAVLDSDAAVHRLYEGEAVPHIESAFPGTTADGKVDRAKLASALMETPDSFKKLEAIVHPLVRQAQWNFLKQQHASGAKLCVLDIPLLFETGGDSFVDVTMVVSAPEAVRAERVLARPGMTEEKLAAIHARQLPDAEKRARADYVIDTGLPLDETKREVDRRLESLEGCVGEKFDLWRAQNEASAGG